jgi:protein-tyrosine phosphatase
MNQLMPHSGVPTTMAEAGVAYQHFPSLLAPQMRGLFQSMLTNNDPLVYNCSAGQDRTGFATAIILTALGVPRDIILTDYHLSTVSRNPEYEVPKIDLTVEATNLAAGIFAKLQRDGHVRTPQPLYDADQNALLEHSFDEIQKRWGSVESYLDQEIGVEAASIQKLRRAYLE